MSDGTINDVTTYYDILEVAPTATPDDIKVAYRRLAKKYHPDKTSHLKKDERDIAEEKFKEVNEANHVLSDPVTRAEYDHQYAVNALTASAPIKPARLVTDLEAYFSKYLSVAPGIPLLLALWTMHSYTFLSFHTVPYLNISSPLYGSGKSTVFKLLAEVVARPYLVVAASIAVIFRKISDGSPTFLLDEAEFLRRRDTTTSELLRIFNAGYQKGGSVERMVAGKLEAFDVFCPKAFASIEGLSPGTPLFDRSITINMQPGDAPQFYKDKETIRTGELQLRLESYAVQTETDLLEIQDTSDTSWPELKRRERELWGPLLFHARLAGPKIEAQAYELAKKLCQEKRRIQSQGDSTVALAHELVYVLEHGKKIQKLGKVESKTAEWLSPTTLGSLVKDEENWGVIAAGKNIKAQAMFMAKFLQRFNITSRKLNGRTLYLQADIIAKLRAHLPRST